MSKQIDFSSLTYRLKSEELPPINFIGLKGPMHICNNTSTEKIKENQKQLKSNIGLITTGKPKFRSKENCIQ